MYTLRQKELFLFVFPDEGPDFTYLFSNCQQMLKNNFLSNEYVLKTQLLRYCVTAQGLVLVEKVFLHFMYFSDSSKFSFHVSEKIICQDHLKKRGQ